jgi:hypothetical protein
MRPAIVQAKRLSTLSKAVDGWAEISVVGRVK